MSDPFQRATLGRPIPIPSKTAVLGLEVFPAGLAGHRSGSIELPDRVRGRPGETSGSGFGDAMLAKAFREDVAIFSGSQIRSLILLRTTPERSGALGDAAVQSRCHMESIVGIVRGILDNAAQLIPDAHMKVGCYERRNQ